MVNLCKNLQRKNKIIKRINKLESTAIENE